MRTVRPVLAPAVVALVALTAACTAGGDEPAPTSAAPTQTTEVEETPTAAAASGAECLIGSWDVDGEQLAASLQEVVAQDMPAEPTVTSSGSSFMTFEDGSLTFQYEEQVLDVAVEAEGQELGLAFSFDGPLTAAYTATDTELTVADVDASGVTQTIEMTVDGEEFDAADAGLDTEEYQGLDLSGTQTYTCEGDELRVTSPASDGVGSSEQVLRRRS